MGIFKKKPEITIQRFCLFFYDSWFQPNIENSESISDFLNVLNKVDPKLLAFDRSVFIREFLALLLEMLGYALIRPVKKDELLVEQSVFTKEYLTEHGVSDIWNRMPEYNHTIMQASQDIMHFESTRRASAVAKNSFIVELAKKFQEDFENTDMECVGRVVNRYPIGGYWWNRITCGYLARTLAERARFKGDIKSSLLLEPMIERCYHHYQNMIQEWKFVEKLK